MNIKALVTIALAGGVAVTVSACGSSAAAKVSGGASGSSNGFNRTGPGGGAPGASGLVAAVSGSTAQVQSTSAQTAVSWTSATTFTDDVQVAKTALKVGECVQAARAQTGSGSSSTASLAAATVRIMNTSGGCTALSQGPGARPSGAPTNVPNGAGPRAFGNVATVGVVTSVASSGFVVKPIGFGGSSNRPVTVVTSSTTTYTETRKATSSAVKVGLCLSASGSTDSIGAVKATRITLSQPTNGVCTQTRFRGFGGGSPDGGFPAGQGAPQNG